LEKAAKLIGQEPAAIQADVSNLSDLDRVSELVANAGGGTFAPLGAITEEHYNQTFDINVKGSLFTVQKLLPLLSEGASIILTGSTAGSEGI
jgi:NAD(P)-dependent dehydrogenase (short-subunit alcohol dehydrogenase family)